MNTKTIILIVDDDLIGQRVLKSLLTNQGYDLILASSGAEALSQASRFVPDLILLDVMMPEMDGFEVCQRLRADSILGEVPIIMVTLLDDSHSRLMGLEAGADDFISKPFDRAELRARVRSITRLNRYRRLHQERIKFERVFELSPDGILIVSENGRIQLANSAMRQLFGSKEGEDLTMLLNNFLPAQPLTNNLTCLGKAITNIDQIEKCETVFVGLDGRRFPVELVAGYFEWEGQPALQIVVRDITERVAAKQQIEQQLEMLHALFASAQKLAQSLELRLTLNVLLDQVTAKLDVDAAEVLLFKPDDGTLEYGAGRGFRKQPSYASSMAPFKISHSPARQIVLEERTISIPNLASCKEHRFFMSLLKEENFITYVGLPLFAKGQIKGVLEVFNRSPLSLDANWLEFLETMAQQAALAIDNASLFEKLQQSNMELSMAYDATLEGWVKALDLRDKETEGHTQRVTEMSLRLAEAMGLSQKEQLHIQRGALLHDIGKIGIPDHILHKPGPLSDSEWEIMRQHPIYAYQMLYPITFLRPALDIPYCHHEKWDGSGYPRGLKGKQIPFSARLFTVVDVWDALTSNRPYRQAWPQEKVLNYLQNQAGKQFDPMIVEAYHSLIIKNILENTPPQAAATVILTLDTNSQRA